MSILITEFSTMVVAEGLDAAAKEYGVMDIVQELHSLGAECQKSGLTIAEAKKGLKMVNVLEGCGLEEDQFDDALKAVIKANNQSFLDAAMELQIIEEESDKLFSEIVEEASIFLTQKQEALKELAEAKDKTAKEKQTLADTLQKTADMGKKFNHLLHSMGVDLERLKKVENLAMTLKKAGVTDNQLDWYIERLNALGQAGISLHVFSQILSAVNLPSAADGGTSLLKKLNEWGGLSEGIVTLKQERQSLVNEVKDLNDKAKQKGALQVDVTNLQGRKNELQGSVYALHAQETATSQSLGKLKTDHKNYSEQEAALVRSISEKQEIEKNLNQSISHKQHDVADLEEKEEKRASA